MHVAIIFSFVPSGFSKVCDRKISRSFHTGSCIFPVSPYSAANRMPQLSYSGPHPTTSISNLSSCVSIPAVIAMTSSGTSQRYFSRRFNKSSLLALSPSSSQVCPNSVLTQDFISSTLPFFSAWSASINPFIIFSQPKNVDARELK